MLVLNRKDGEWVEVTHAASGDKLRIRTHDLRRGKPGTLKMAFDDDARNFDIERPERAIAAGDRR